jgi:hypothetical protein
MMQPVLACFPVAPELTPEELDARVVARLGVNLPAGILDTSEPNGLVRAQQLVDALDVALHEPPGPSSQAGKLLRDFLVARLLNAPGLGSAEPARPAGLSDALAAAMEGELERVLDDWLMGQGATLESLLTSNTTYLNPELAAHYGLLHTPSQDWEPVTEPAEQRGGLLTLGAFLTRFSSPPARAMHLAQALACTTVPPPPGLDSVWAKPSRPPAKDVVAVSYADDQAVCWACHQYYVGFAIALDRYDELGRYRDTLAGKPIDTSYRLANYTSSALAAPQGEARDQYIEFATVHDLGQALSHNTAVRGCLAQQLNTLLGSADLSETELGCVLRKFDEKDASFLSLLAILAPHYLAMP